MEIVYNCSFDLHGDDPDYEGMWKVLGDHKFKRVAPAEGGGYIVATQSSCWRTVVLNSLADDAEISATLMRMLVAAINDAGIECFKLQISGATLASLRVYDNPVPEKTASYPGVFAPYPYDRRPSTANEWSPMLEAYMRSRGYLG